jgi:hypothetical protein
MLPLDVVTSEVLVETPPTVTAIVGSGAVVTAVPPIVAPIVVALPASPPVNVAV